MVLPTTCLTSRPQIIYDPYGTCSSGGHHEFFLVYDEFGPKCKKCDGTLDPEYDPRHVIPKTAYDGFLRHIKIQNSVDHEKFAELFKKHFKEE